MEKRKCDRTFSLKEREGGKKDTVETPFRYLYAQAKPGGYGLELLSPRSNVSARGQNKKKPLRKSVFPS